MDARPIPTTALADRTDADVAALARWGVLAAVGLLGSIALLLAARRLVGALVDPLSPAELLATGTVAALAAWVPRRLWSLARPRPSAAWLDAVVRWAPPVAVVSIAAALSLPGASRLGLAGLWLVVILAEVDVYRRAGGGRFRWPAWRRSSSSTDSLRAAHAILSADEPTDALGDDVLQQLTRVRDADGGVVLYGMLRAELAAGQRSEQLHVAFCPPFARVPRVDFEQADGPEARIKLAQVLAYGARLEVRLARAASEASSVLVEVSVRGEPAS